MKLSYESIGKQTVTFASASGTQSGDVCCISANNTVSNLSVSGSNFVGYVADVAADGAAAVVLHGYVEMPYSGATAPTLGWCGLASDGDGALIPSETARAYLVGYVNTTDKTVGFFM